MASRIITKKGSGAPLASDLVHGELAVDTVNKRLYTENAGGTVIEVGTSPSTIDINAGTIDGTVIGGSSAAAGSFTTISASGEIAANGGVAFGDNDKATFGASDDLQIYHDGSNSYVRDAGTGNLIMGAGAGLFVKNAALDENLLTAYQNGAVTLYYDNAAKLATTATGIDVTGTATMDGLTVSGAQNSKVAYFDDTSEGGYRQLQFTSSNNGQFWDINSQGTSGGLGGVLTLSTRSIDRLSINTDGDISFYEDTGTSPKFFWDASAESLTLSGSGAGSLTLDRGASGNQIKFTNAGTTLGYFGYIDGTGFSITGSDGGSDVVVDSAGNVGIGTSTPSQALDVVGNIEVSGGVYLGGTGAANLLDDYEEGAFTAEFADAATGGNTASFGTLGGTYVKVGSLVTISLYMLNIDTTGLTSTNDIVIRNLPFVAASGQAGVWTGSMFSDRLTFTDMSAPYVFNGQSYFKVMNIVSGSGDDPLPVSAVESGVADLYFSLSYRV